LIQIKVRSKKWQDIGERQSTKGHHYEPYIALLRFTQNGAEQINEFARIVG
jgi:hypothetical protein